MSERLRLSSFAFSVSKLDTSAGIITVMDFMFSGEVSGFICII